MEKLLSYIFLFLIHSCAIRGQYFDGRISRQHIQIDEALPAKLRYTELIKKKITEALGLSVLRDAEVEPKPRVINVEQKSHPTEYKLLQVTSFNSEPPDDHMNDSILQFRLEADNRGKRVEVNNVRLFVRIKMKKNKNDRKNKQKSENLTKDEKLSRKRRRKKQMKEIKLVVSKVTPDGALGEEVTSVKTKIRKSKLLRLTLPKEDIQSVIDSKNKTVQYYVKCFGCDKNARMITAVKKVKRAKRVKSGRQLMKRRPFIILQSHIINGS